jgi:hypothetical protein
VHASRRFGVTFRAGAQVQVNLILPPHGSHEIVAPLASSSVQPWAARSMRSADFCAAVKLPYGEKIARVRRTPAGFATP